MALVTHLLIVNSHNHVTFRFLGLLILFAVTFSVHNKQVMAAEDSCVFNKYSSENKESLDDAQKKLAPFVGKTYESLDGTDWKYDIGICAHVGDNQDAAVMQYKINDDKESHMLGSLKQTHIIVGTDWIMLEYKMGENYSSHCNREERRSVIMISCDPAADENSPKMVFMKEENALTDQCYYLFEMKHPAACPTADGSTSLSVGTILIVIFFSVVGVYLLVGFLYSRFVLRAKGIEQIPNYEFWKDFGNLQAYQQSSMADQDPSLAPHGCSGWRLSAAWKELHSDGCDFICRSKGRRRANNFGGIGDDQLESAEEIHDDHLLPM